MLFHFESTMNKYITLFCCLLAFSKGGYAQGGTKTSSPDVVNGTDAKAAQFPYQISMQVIKQHFCGGSILNENYILTASHCTKDFSEDNQHFIRVVAGTINKDEPQQEVELEKIIQHEDYDPDDANRNDIALLKLKQPLEYNDKVQPVTLAEAHSPIPTGSAVVLSGWGGLGGPDNLKPTILQAVTIEVADQDYCVKVMKDDYNRNVRPTNVCAYNPKFPQGECRGDSGGPLTLDGKQVGIVSWSAKDPYCGSTKHPGVYTRVPEYIDWINEHMAEH